MIGKTRASEPRSAIGDEPTGADDLVRRFFATQDERPRSIREVEIDRIEPFLRNLLFTDGTVTRALGVQMLDAISVRRISQLEVPVPAELVSYLEVEPGDLSIRRRVGIGVGSAPAPLLWAESYIVPERLPLGFVALLDAPGGIGQSLQRAALESRRELLWFGLDASPEWAIGPGAGSRETIRRLYRVLSRHRASILISESFAVEEGADGYRLARPGGVNGAPGAAGEKTR